MLVCLKCSGKEFVFAQTELSVYVMNEYCRIKRSKRGTHSYKIREMVCLRCGETPAYKKEKGTPK